MTIDQNDNDATDSVAIAPPPARIRKELPPYKPSSTWLLSFTDITGLMLTFFVMLFAMSDPNRDTWSSMAVSFGVEFNTKTGSAGKAGINAHPEMNRLREGRGLDLGYLSTVLHHNLSKNADTGKMEITTYSDKIVLSFPASLLFERGSADLNDTGKKALFTIGQNFRGIRNKIEIYGHTEPDLVKEKDSLPQWQTNWGLSLARATSVAAILKESGYTRNIALLGLAATEFDKIDPKFSQEERLKKANRVEIVIREYSPPILRGF